MCISNTSTSGGFALDLDLGFKKANRIHHRRRIIPRHIIPLRLATIAAPSPPADLSQSFGLRDAQIRVEKCPHSG